MNIRTGNTSSADRVVDLERRLAEMQAEIALLKAATSTPVLAMCAACRLIVERGGAAACNCVVFGPKVTCAVAS